MQLDEIEQAETHASEEALGGASCPLEVQNVVGALVLGELQDSEVH